MDCELRKYLNSISHYCYQLCFVTYDSFMSLVHQLRTCCIVISSVHTISET